MTIKLPDELNNKIENITITQTGNIPVVIVGFHCTKPSNEDLYLISKLSKNSTVVAFIVAKECYEYVTTYVPQPQEVKNA